jgi:hypothetical protein
LLRDRLSQDNRFRIIDKQYSHRHPTDCGRADQNELVPPEMVAPNIATGIEETDYVFRFGIISRDVWALEPIAMNAGKSQILEFC